MKTFFRWAFRLFILLIVLGVAGILLLDTMARELVQYQLSGETGLEVKVGHVTVGLLHPSVTIENLVIYNSAEFGGSPFIELPELHADYDPNALRSRRLHCKLVRLNLAQINLVENKQGRKNFDRFQKQFSPAAPAASNGPSGKKPPAQNSWDTVDFAGIDTFNLTLGKVTYLRMRQPEKVDELKLNVNHQIYTNVRTEKDFSGVLLLAMLKSGANLMQGDAAQTWLQLLAPPTKPK